MDTDNWVQLATCSSIPPALYAHVASVNISNKLRMQDGGRGAVFTISQARLMLSS
jgi:hypothetical protein